MRGAKDLLAMLVFDAYFAPFFVEAVPANVVLIACLTTVSIAAVIGAILLFIFIRRRKRTNQP